MRGPAAVVAPDGLGGLLLAPLAIRPFVGPPDPALSLESLERGLVGLAAVGLGSRPVAACFPSGAHRDTVSRWKAGGHVPHNVKAVVMLLQSLDRLRRIPKQKRYTVAPT